MIEQTLRRLEQHPRQWLIVTAGTFVIGLVVLLPLVDEYQRMQLERAELEAQLAECEQLASNRKPLAERVRVELAHLEQIEARTVSEDRIQPFRAEIVARVRASGCHLRRVATASMQRRPWLKQDDPLLPATAGKHDRDRTDYELTIQPITVTVSGTMPQVKRLLEMLEEHQPIGYAKNFSLRPVGTSTQEVVLELELWLYGLEEAQQIAA